MGNERAEAVGSILSRALLMFGEERLNKLEGRLNRGTAGGLEDESELSMLAGGQEGVNEARETPRRSSIKQFGRGSRGWDQEFGQRLFG